jgi:hypothetical protein
MVVIVELGMEVCDRKSSNSAASSNIPTALSSFEFSNTVVQETAIRITSAIAHTESVVFVELRL